MTSQSVNPLVLAPVVFPDIMASAHYAKQSDKLKIELYRLPESGGWGLLVRLGEKFVSRETEDCDIWASTAWKGEPDNPALLGLFTIKEIEDEQARQERDKLAKEKEEKESEILNRIADILLEHDGTREYLFGSMLTCLNEKNPQLATRMKAEFPDLPPADKEDDNEVRVDWEEMRRKGWTRERPCARKYDQGHPDFSGDAPCPACGLPKAHHGGLI